MGLILRGRYGMVLRGLRVSTLLQLVDLTKVLMKPSFVASNQMILAVSQATGRTRTERQRIVRHQSGSVSLAVTSGRRSDVRSMVVDINTTINAPSSCQFSHQSSAAKNDDAWMPCAARAETDRPTVVKTRRYIVIKSIHGPFTDDETNC